VGGDLSCVCPALVLFLEMLLDLPAARTRRSEVLLTVALDLRLTALAALDLIA
jgi:hypothetical protein